jgi:hypothetical protein
LIRPAVPALLLFAAVACGQGASESTASNVDELTSDGFVDEDFDGADLDGLGADPEPMISDEAIDALDDRSDADEEAEAEALALSRDPFDEGNALGEATVLLAKKSNGGTTAPSPVHCKKRIHATFAIYTYLTNDLKTNGCWVAERTTQDPTYRECHSNGDIKDPHGVNFFYDDTNPSNPYETERARVGRCAKGEKLGFEYMAFRDDRWRIVRAPHVAAYFAELYVDDTRIDNFWYDRGIYRGNSALKKYARVAPMLNVAPYPPRYSTRDIEKEILKVCSHVKNHGFIGLYEWHFPLDHDSPYTAAIVGALNRCTRK